MLLSMMVLPAAVIHSQEFDVKGQLSSWGTGTGSHADWKGNWGIRYIPHFNLSYSQSETNIFNTEVMVNSYYGTDFHSDDHALKLYRAILRYTTPQTETQLGLQQINFGPAQLLRPLMWFDRVDPRDPLKLTDGVYSLRYKYSFVNNSIIWLWGLYGNSGTKGYEQIRTKHKTPEFGGRIQLTVPAGEVAATVHTRDADAVIDELRENRYAVDGRWDVGIGFWFESVWQHSTSNLPMPAWNRMTTIGGDYTIPAGNGIYVLAEHMQSAISQEFWNVQSSTQLSAFMATYPLGTLDNLAVQEYYNWQDHTVY